MQEIVRAVQSQEIPDTEIACIVASTKDAGGIQKALALNIPKRDIIVVDPREHKRDGKVDQKEFGEAILKPLQECSVTVVTQNGWMPKTPSNVIDAFEGRIFNQHPGPPEEFGGKGMYGSRVHAAVLLFRRITNGAMWTKVIAQRVHKEFDKGRTVQQERVPIEENDTIESLQLRALAAEHRVQIRMLQQFVRGTLTELEPEFLVRAEEMAYLIQAKEQAIMMCP